MSTKDLKALADSLLNELSAISNSPTQLVDDAKERYTITVGLSSNEIIVAGNVEARRLIDPTEKDFVKVTRDGKVTRARHVNYGITDELATVIFDTVSKSELYLKTNFNVAIVEEAVNPIHNKTLNTIPRKLAITPRDTLRMLLRTI